MKNLRVGLPRHKGDLSRYGRHYRVVEIRPGERTLPKEAELRGWRKLVPEGFQFSVVLPASVGALETSSKAEAELAHALNVSRFLRARTLVVQTPASVNPAAKTREALKELFGRLPGKAAQLIWEPKGVWEPEEAHELAQELGAVVCADPSQQPMQAGPFLYGRLRAFGAFRSIGPAAIEATREACRSRREAIVIVEAASPRRIVDGLLAAPGGNGLVIDPELAASIILPEGDSE